MDSLIRSLADSKRFASFSKVSSTRERENSDDEKNAVLRLRFTVLAFVVGGLVRWRGGFGEDVVTCQTFDRVAACQKARLEIGLQDMSLVFT